MQLPLLSYIYNRSSNWKNNEIKINQKSFSIENRRYIGSKTKLRDWIISNIKKECIVGGSFADIFAGTGSVAAGALPYFKRLILNDILHSNFASYNAFFGKEVYDIEKLRLIIEAYNSIDITKIGNNYFSENFGGKYFSSAVAKQVGFIRNNIEEIKKMLSQREYYILLTSLFYSIDKIANTVGHYDAFIQKEPRINELTIRLIQPLETNQTEIYQQDANKLALKLKADVVYIDPPYNSRQYSRFYHILETLTKWNNPKLYGTALKPETENSSDYCKKTAPQAFQDLIEKLDCKYIAVSYNNTYASKSNSSRNKITHNQLVDILREKGKTKIFKQNHRYFNAGNTSFDNHQEWLFITKVT